LQVFSVKFYQLLKRNLLEEIEGLQGLSHTFFIVL